MGFFQVELIYRPVDDISSGQSCILSGEEVRGNTVRRKKNRKQDTLTELQPGSLCRNPRFTRWEFRNFLTRNGWQAELAKCM